MVRWRKVPFGYRFVPVPGGGWALEIDRMSYSVVRRIVDDVLDGKPITRVARELNQEKYLTPGDYNRAVGLGNPMMIDDSADDKPPAYVLTKKSKIKSKWSPTTLRQMLRSKALLGHSHYEGETVRDDNGMPVLIGEPLVTLDEWELLQAPLDESLSTRNDRKLETSPMLGVLICGVCGKKLHHSRTTVKGKEYRYYKCENKDTAPIPAELAEVFVEEHFLDEVGDPDVRERKWVPGDSREGELQQALTALDELSQQLVAMTSVAGKERVKRQMVAQDARVAELEAAPSESAHWEYKATGETYRKVWEASDVEGGGSYS